MKTKKCSKCLQYKELLEFRIHKKANMGLTPRCKNCLSRKKNSETINNLGEIWKNVIGYEEFYEVSSMGRVKTKECSRISIKKRKIFLKSRLIKGWVSNVGYPSVVLRDKNNILKTLSVHRLVAMAFLENKSNKPVVNHKSGIKTDNNIENLEWCTYAENAIHAHKEGLMNPISGVMHPCAKLDNDKVKHIRETVGVMSNSKLADMYNVSRGAINSVRTFKTWKI